MPEKWTGDLIGRMHNEEITMKELADELDVCKPYVSMILNGTRNPEGAQQRMEAAVDAILARRENAESEAS